MPEIAEYINLEIQRRVEGLMHQNQMLRQGSGNLQPPRPHMLRPGEYGDSRGPLMHDHLRNRSLLSKDSPRYTPTGQPLSSRRSNSYNNRFPSENTINFKIQEFNQTMGSTKMGYANPPSDVNLYYDFKPESGVIRNRTFDMHQQMYPPQNPFAGQVYYNNMPQSPYGTHGQGQPHKVPTNPYLSAKFRPDRQSGYPVVPNNSAMPKSTESNSRGRPPRDPNQRKFGDLRAMESRDLDHDRLFKKKLESPRHYPGSREFKPSREVRVKERRLSRERNRVDSDLRNVINKYKYGVNRKRF